MSAKFGFLKTVAAPPDDRPAAKEPKSRPRAARTIRRGRRKGKRSDPAFEQVTIYIRRRTHKEAKVQLLRAETRQEFSELVEDLVGKWLK